MKVKSLKLDILPREKIIKYGAKKLHNYELIAIMLGSGIQGCNVLELARKIDRKINQVPTGKLSVDDLRNIKGLGNAKATMLVAAIELASRFGRERNHPVFSIEDTWKLCSDFKSSKKEHVAAFYLDTQRNLIERRIISIGTLDKSILHPRDVFEPAIELSAAGVILAHNHPSGNLAPSLTDLNITDRMTKAGEIIGISIVDHIIITDKEYFSIIQNLN